MVQLTIAVVLVFNVGAEWMAWKEAPPDQRLWARLVRFIDAGRPDGVGCREHEETSEMHLLGRREEIVMPRRRSGERSRERKRTE